MAFAQDVSPAPAAAQDPAADEATTVVVTGLRRSIASARNIKKNSDQIVDAIVAEDIGKLPDTTASDSLARITGVMVQRGGGEAGQVLVRGLPNIATSYNGRDIFTAEARYVAVQDFPAGGVAALEVFKSTTADQVEGGIAGLINVRSRRPFDFKGLEIAGEVRAMYSSQAGETTPNGNLLISNRWQTANGEFGALLNVSFTELQYLDSARWIGGYIASMDGTHTADPAANNGKRYGDFVGIFEGQGKRSRPSLNAALQWRNDKLELYADVLYQGFENKVSDRQLAVPLWVDNGNTTYSNIVLKPGTNQVASMTATNTRRPELFQGATHNHTDTWQFAIGGAWTSGPWKVTADLARTESKYDSSIYSYDTAAASSPTVNVSYDVDREDGGVEFELVNFDATDPNNFIYRGFYDRHLVAEGDDIQFRTDVDYNTGNDLFTKVEFGMRYVDRNAAFNNGDRYAYQEGLGIRLQNTGLDLEVTPSGFDGSDVQKLRAWISPTYNSLRGHVVQLRQLAGFAQGDPAFNPNQAFTANEKALAGYGQVHYGFGSAIPVDGVIGVRVVKTEESVTGFARTIVNGVETFTPRNEQSDYTDVLPSLSARVRFDNDIQLRLAANKTRTRPEFNQLNPSLFVDPNVDSNGFRNASGGNIDLKPIEATNYDLSLEHYYSTTGFMSLGVFKRDIKGFIVNSTNTVSDPVYGQLRVNQPINANDTKLQGVEASLTTFMDYSFMPDWATDFGIQLNATYIDSDQVNGADYPGISKYAYNIIGMYEHGPFSARLAYNYRSKWLTVNELSNGGNPGTEYVKAVDRLDFSANWSPKDNITLNFDVSNILGTPFRSYREYTNGDGGYMPRDVRFEETIYSLGLRFRY
jgi:TonB-dependent receptor